MHLGGPGGFLGVHSALLTHGRHDGDVGVLALLVHLLDPLTNLALGELDIVLGVAAVVHEGKETVVSHIKLGGVMLAHQSWQEWQGGDGHLRAGTPGG